jgi:hypothetical protein
MDMDLNHGAPQNSKAELKRQNSEEEEEETTDTWILLSNPTDPPSSVQIARHS